MKISVIGSTSPTGLHLLKQGVERGHEMTAFTRRPQLLAPINGLTRTIAGDGLNLSDIREAVREQDAVIAIIGNRGLGPTTVAADVTRNLILAMQDEGVPRLVCVSSYLAGPVSKPPVLTPFFQWLLRRPLADRRMADDLLTASRLDYTIVRPGRLLDQPATGRVRQQKDGKPFETGPFMIGRADLAATLLDVLAQADASRQVINVAWG